MNFLTWIQYIPELIGIFNAVKKRIEEVETDRKVSDDLKAIQRAFDEKNIDHLNSIFNNGLPNTTDTAKT